VWIETKKLRDTEMTSLDEDVDYAECCNQASMRLALELKSKHKRARIQLTDGKADYELPSDFIAMYDKRIWWHDRNEDIARGNEYKCIEEVSYRQVKDERDLDTRIGKPRVFYLDGNNINLYPAPSVEQEEFTYRGLDGTIIDSLPLTYFDKNVIEGTYPPDTQVTYRSENSDEPDYQDIYFDYYNYEPVRDENSMLDLPKVLELPLVYLTASIICEENDDYEGQVKMMDMFRGALHTVSIKSGSAVNNDDSSIAVNKFFIGAR
jgi:hypothetical protein